MLNGIINVYKERGFTSHDVVAKMRGICGQKKIGHTGTLDPYATGVLPVCLGTGTRLCDMLTDQDKEYVAELLLGQETDTEDVTGTVLRTGPVCATPEEVRAAVSSFQGTYLQTPPMYSALKVNGKKLYELAREGKVIERPPREVQISELEILKLELPVVKFRVVCSKGTYIRTLCKDIGEKLGCGGTMQSLERTRVGRFRASDAVTLKELQEHKENGTLETLLCRVDSCFSDLPALHVKENYRKLLENGNAFDPKQTQEGEVFPEPIRVYAGERFYGIYAYRPERQCYLPVKMFLENG